uniref:Peroxiredoxin-like 2A n=1 Tax=Canis lupus familiaris TaxID=9615 RepID=A0A8C0TRQ2_CANLF
GHRSRRTERSDEGPRERRVEGCQRGEKRAPHPPHPPHPPRGRSSGAEAPPTGGGAWVAWRRGSYQARGRSRGRGAAPQQQDGGGAEAPPTGGGAWVAWRPGSYQARGRSRGRGAQGRRRGGRTPGAGRAWRGSLRAPGPRRAGGAGRGARAHVTSAAQVRKPRPGRVRAPRSRGARPHLRGPGGPQRPQRPGQRGPAPQPRPAPPRPAAASGPQAPSERALAPGERAGQPQDPSFFSVGMWSIGAGALGAAALALLLANTDVFLSKSQKATLEYLEDIDLKTLEKEPRTFKAKELWEKNGAVIMAVRRPGCFLCREEAADLSSLKPKLDELGVPLYAVVKEQIRTEVQDFQPYFKGEIFLDEKKKFYGPQRRKMMFMGFVRLGVWYNFFRARNGGFSGNLEGEGFILGGVFVVGPGKQGILLEHREKEFGDKVNPVSVLEAARKIQTQTSAAETK